MRILGINYHNVTFREALDIAFKMFETTSKGEIYFLNLDCLYRSVRDREYRRALNRASLVLSDGVGLKVATWLFGGKMRENCNGTDFSPFFMEEIARNGYGVYLLGGKDNVASAAAENLRQMFPRLLIKGTHDGFFDNDDEIIDDINRSGAEVLFVAMGAPLQEKWIARNRHRLNPRICLGVGGLLDYLSGYKIRAPHLWRSLHLEWLWRVFREPQRLFKRYFMEDMGFMIYLLYIIIKRKFGVLWGKKMRNPAIFIFFFLTLIFTRIAFAQQGNWSFAGWYGGGCYPNIVFDPNVRNRVYLTSDVAGAWRSDNGGEQWHFINQGLNSLNVAQLAVAKANSNVLYAATVRGIYYSLNAGSSWQKADDAGGALVFQRPQSHRPITISARNAGKVCAGTSKGEVFCSQNYGKSWVPIPAYLGKPTPITSLSFVSGDNGLLVGNTTGLLKYSFNTKTWYPYFSFNHPVTDFTISQKKPGMLVVAGEKYLLITLDNGKTWQRSADIPEGKSYRVILDDSKTSPVIIVAWLQDWNGGLVISSDGGVSWKKFDGKFFPDTVGNPTRSWAALKTRPTAVRIDPFDPERFFLTDWWGVWRTDNRGYFWVEKIKGAPNSVGSDIFMSAQGDLYVATMDNGLLRSSDGGKTYQMLFPKKGYSTEINGHLWQVLVVGNNRIVATSSPWGANINQVIISDDGGQNFRIARAGLPAQRPKGNTMWGQGYPRGLAVDPANANVLYLGMDGDDLGGIFRSQDAGSSWARLPGQPSSKRYITVCLSIKILLTLYSGQLADPAEESTNP